MKYDIFVSEYVKIGLNVQEEATVASFAKLQELDKVRFLVKEDDNFDIDNVCPEGTEEERREVIGHANRDGFFGIVSEYKDIAGDWQHADSVWGFVGDDWKNSGYDLDLMRAAVELAQAVPVIETKDLVVL